MPPRHEMTDHDLLVKIDGRLEDVQTDVMKLREVVIEGNGKPSLVERTGKLEDWRGLYNSRRAWWARLTATVAGTLILIGCVWIWKIAVEHSDQRTPATSVIPNAPSARPPLP